MTVQSNVERSVRRVLMTTDAVGGVWTFCVELARALQRHGVEIALATMGPPPSAGQRRQIAALPNVQLHEGPFALEWMDDPWKEVDAAGQWLEELAGSFCPDVIHLNGYVHAVLPWTVPVLVTAHSCVATWWQAVERSEVPERFSEYLRRVQMGLERADALIAPTAALMAALSTVYSLPVGQQIIANGRSTHPFHVAEKTPSILSAGRLWDRAKNLQILVEAAVHLPLPIRFAGAGGEALSNIEQLGLLCEPELADALAATAIYAAPALYEPFGLSILEAALSGCALVLSDILSLREVWSDAAIYLAPDDARAWQNCLRDLCADPDLCAGLGKSARARARIFTPERCALNYLDSYGQLMGDTAAALIKEVA